MHTATEQTRIFRTAELARIVGVHPNTVRFYERIGLLAKVPRDTNGYRRFSWLHLQQLRAIRAVYRHGWFSREISAAGLKVLLALHDWRLADAISLAQMYLELVTSTLAFARETAGILDRWANGEHQISTGADGLTRREAAQRLGLTAEQLRSWERSGLLAVPRRGPNLTRCYGLHEMERLRIIKLLRQAGYSPVAILASFTAYDEDRHDAVLPALHKLEPVEGVAWVLAGDRLIEALEQAQQAARELCEIVAEAQAL